MARADTKATLQIVAQLRDQASAGFTKLAASVGRITNAFATLKGAIVGIAGALALKRLAGAVQSTVANVDRIAKLARSLGSSAEDIAALETAFEDAGVGAERLHMIMTMLQSARARATRGMAADLDAFAQIGISLRDVQTLDPVAFMQRMSSGLEDLGTQQQKLTVLQKIWSENYTRMIELLGRGRMSFDEQIAVGRRLAAGMNEQGVAAEEFMHRYLHVQRELQAVWREVAFDLMPTLNATMLEFRDFLRDHKETIVAGLQAITKALLGLLSAFGTLTERLSLSPSAQEFAKAKGPTSRDVSSLEVGQLSQALGFEDDWSKLANLKWPDLSKQTQQLQTQQKVQEQIVGDAKEWAVYAEKVAAAFTKGAAASDEMASRMGQAFASSAIDQFASAVTDLSFGAKKFSEAVDDLIKNLGQLALQILITGILKRTFGIPFRRGGIVDPIQHYQSGGVAHRPQVAVFGEVPEAFVPLPDGRRIPVNLRGGGNVYNVSIHAIDTQSFRAALASEREFLSLLQLDSLDRRRPIRQSAGLIR